MRKFFLVFLLIFPQNLFAENSDNFFQGIWANMVDYDYEEEYEKSSKDGPEISGRVITDISFDNNYESNDSKDKFNDATVLGRLFSDLSFTKSFSIKTNIFLSRVDASKENEKRKNSPSGGGDMAFENTGLYVRELVLDYSKENFSVIAGKYTANFGTAWRWGRGIWSNSLPIKYIQKEKLGFGGVYRIGDEKRTGRYNFGFSAFTNDRKNLDNSIFNHRDVGNKYDAKAGDTRGLDSYNASLDINFDFGYREKLSYHFSYLNLAVNSNQTSVKYSKIADQKGFVLGTNYIYPINDALVLDSLVEYVEMKNVGGNSDSGNKALSLSLVGEIYNNWNVTLANSYYKNSNLSDGSLNYNENLYEFSTGYKFDKTKYFDQLLLQIGYKKLRNNYQSYINEQNAAGVLLRYIKSF
ncbi:MAG: hypothetical protein FJ368_02415 [Pelagibacterales bacterium]|nr:hypothetical protein [Pelagibacterales bacterium]